MNREEFNESLSQLEQQLEEMNNRLEDAKRAAEQSAPGAV